MTKTVIAIGGGELRSKQTLKIDAYIADLAKAHAGEARGYALFLGTASHDSLPYFNTFRKTYTSEFDLKADVAILTKNCMDMARIEEKFLKADMIYVGGGDTKFMMDVWRSTGVYDLILNAYDRGVIICGLSAGAICWFNDMFTDYDIMEGNGNEYKRLGGFGWFEGTVSPHYDERRAEFDALVIKDNIPLAYGLENNGAIVIEDGKIVKSLTSGGKAYRIINEDGRLLKEVI